MKKIKAFWESLEDVTAVSNRELFLGLLCCALGGIVLGVFFSPKKTVTIGCNNGNNYPGAVEDRQADDE